MDYTEQTNGNENRRDFLRYAFYSMMHARILENKLSSLYKAGKIVGGVYLGRGQEALSAALGTSLIKGKDVYCPLIRDQAGRHAFGEDFYDGIRTYLGSKEGPMRGRDGNIHRGRPLDGMPAMISHLGAQVSVVGGMLLARRMKGVLGDAVGATCVGDGATSTGAFHEGLNFAAVERLPLVIVVANNQFAYSTPTNRQFACVDLVERARGYGVRGYTVDGTDLVACASVISEAVKMARSGHGPQLVVAHLLRLSGHGEHDDASYIPEQVKRGQYGRDCLDVAEKDLLASGVVTAEEISQWQEMISEEVQRAVASVQQELPPDPYCEDWSSLVTKFPFSSSSLATSMESLS